MVESPSLLLAFAAGFVSFISPCCLPLVPGYLAAVSGKRPDSAKRVQLDRRVLGRSLLFVGTFSLIFIVLGLTATAAGSFLFANKPLLNRISGVAIMTMGLLFVGSVFFVGLNREFRVHALLERAGRGGPVIAGAAFALAWTPCVGPTLGAILGLAANSSGTSKGVVLLASYSAGLALPFLVSSIAFNFATQAFAFFKRHYVAIQIGSGIVLVAMGYIVLTNQLFQLNIEAQHLLGKLGLNFFQSV